MIFTNLVKKYSKKKRKPLKIGSVQPDLDQTLSKFSYHHYQNFDKAPGSPLSK